MRALQATGLLAELSDAGVLDAADVHVARRLGELAREESEPVLLATALAVRAVRLGSTCLELGRMREVTVDEEFSVDVAALPWPSLDAVVEELRRSPLVVGSVHGELRPLRLVDTDAGPLLYLDRYWRQEQTVRDLLDDRSLVPPAVDVEELRARLAALFPAATAPDRQRVAAALAATKWTTVLAGGPGTGKTTTVARILALLHRPGLRVALAAPTGKAAARLEESVREQAGALGLPALSAVTLHRLLGWRPDSSTRFRHDASNRLPYDVVVVDETSMVSLTMMARLLEAMRPDARLILVGDPDQLTSVDAGAVLADLVARPVTGSAAAPVLQALVGDDLTAADDPAEAALSPLERERLSNGIVRLSRGRRFGGTIAALAVAVREGDADRAWELLTSGAPEVSFAGPASLAGLVEDVRVAADALTQAAAAGDVARALQLLEAHKLLCAHRRGPYGVREWARRAAEWAGAPPPAHDWYPGQPLLVTKNDHDARVYNGDTGVVVARRGDLVAAFGRGSEPVLLHPGRLADVQTVHAMTIHRSQGSQYDRVSVLLPETASALLTRELLYTAITRAKQHVRVIGTQESVRAAVGRQVLRASGLRRVVQP